MEGDIEHSFTYYVSLMGVIMAGQVGQPVLCRNMSNLEVIVVLAAK